MKLQGLNLLHFFLSRIEALMTFGCRESLVNNMTFNL